MSNYSIGQIVNVIRTHEANIKTLAAEIVRHDQTIKSVDPSVLNELSADEATIAKQQIDVSNELMKPLTTATTETMSSFTENILAASSTSLYALDPKLVSTKTLNFPLHIHFQTEIETKNVTTSEIINKHVEENVVDGVSKNTFLSVYATQPENYYSYLVTADSPILNLDPSFVPVVMGNVQMAKMKIESAVFKDFTRMKWFDLGFDKLKDTTTDVLELSIKNVDVYQQIKTETPGQFETIATNTTGHIIFEKINGELCVSGQFFIPDSTKFVKSQASNVMIIAKEASIIEANFDNNIVGALTKVLTYSELAKKGKADEYAMDNNVVKVVNKFVAAVNYNYRQSFSYVNTTSGKVESRLTTSEVNFMNKLHKTFQELSGFKYVMSIDNPQGSLSSDPIFIEPSNIWTGIKVLEI